MPTLTNEFMTKYLGSLTIGLVDLTATRGPPDPTKNTFRTFEAFGVVTIVIS